MVLEDSQSFKSLDDRIKDHVTKWSLKILNHSNLWNRINVTNGEDSRFYSEYLKWLRIFKDHLVTLFYSKWSLKILNHSNLWNLRIMSPSGPWRFSNIQKSLDLVDIIQFQRFEWSRIFKNNVTKWSLKILNHSNLWNRTMVHYSNPSGPWRFSNHSNLWNRIMSPSGPWRFSNIQIFGIE